MRSNMLLPRVEAKGPSSFSNAAQLIGARGDGSGTSHAAMGATNDGENTDRTNAVVGARADARSSSAGLPPAPSSLELVDHWCCAASVPVSAALITPMQRRQQDHGLRRLPTRSVYG